MKRIIALLLAVTMCLAFTGCDNKTTENETDSADTTVIETEPPEPEIPTAQLKETVSTDTTVIETEPPESEIPTAQLKETVSTDIVEFTLEHSKLTYYVSNVSTNYVEATDKANPMFAAKMGTCYVSMTVTITNKDRGGSMGFCGEFTKWDAADWSVTYNGEEYDMYGFHLNIDNRNAISLSYGAIVDRETGKVIREVGTGGDLIWAGQTITYRLFGIIKVDPASLNDGFELNVNVPNSKGEFEDFKYIVPAIS